jgi:hypothetical protein
VGDQQAGRPTANKVNQIKSPAPRSHAEIDDSHPITMRDLRAVPVKRRKRPGQEACCAVANDSGKSPWYAQRCRCGRTGR